MSEVNHPKHYNQGKIEVIEFIEDQGLGYHLGNAIKYISRCDYKGKKKQDLEKAIWYLKRELELLNPEPRRPNDMSKGCPRCGGVLVSYRVRYSIPYLGQNKDKSHKECVKCSYVTKG